LPITEANLGDGIFPASDFLAAGGRFGVGSDSNVLIDAAEELRLLEYGQRLARRSRNVLAQGAGRSTGGDLFPGRGTGRCASPRSGAVGLAAGAPADMVSLDLDHPALLGGGDAALDAWVFAARGGAVESVWRGGVEVVTGGRHRDRAAIARRYREAVAKVLLVDQDSRPAHPRRPGGGDPLRRGPARRPHPHRA
jgi:cytosine/adenosine deaminase-related metal-dependent hydrolase